MVPHLIRGISIGTDSLGFIYISGYYNNEATFGGITLSNTNQWPFGYNKDHFVAKLDSTGDVIWAIPGGDLVAGGSSDDRALGMHVTAGGDVFITGTFWDVYYLGLPGAAATVSVPAYQLNEGDNSLLGKIDKDGNPQWVIGFGSDGLAPG